VTLHIEKSKNEKMSQLNVVLMSMICLSNITVCTANLCINLSFTFIFYVSSAILGVSAAYYEKNILKVDIVFAL